MMLSLLLLWIGDWKFKLVYKVEDLADEILLDAQLYWFGLELGCEALIFFKG